MGLTGIAEDCSVKEIGNNMVIVTNVDIFTPIHDDPVIMGEITACNSTNDLFAMNVVDIVMYLSFLGVPMDQPQEVTEGLLSGQIQFLKQFNARVDGGHTIINPWPLMGGIVVGISDKKDLIPKQLNPDILQGDLILTKPMGLQAVMAAYRVLKTQPSLLEDFDQDSLKNSIKLGEKIMRMSNYNVSKTIRDENLHDFISAMTDITGFGLNIHASEMIQERTFDITIHTLPIIQNSDRLSQLFGYDLLGGCSAETAGAMLIALDTNKIDTEEFQRILKSVNVNSWKVGSFKKGSGKTKIIDDIETIQIEKI